jgi:hypothetical protein
MYGLNVRSQVPLHQHRPAPTGAPTDLDIVLGAPARRTTTTPPPPPPGRILLDLRANRQYYTATVDDEGYHLRFYGTCDIDLDPSLARAVVHMVDGADPALVSVLASGTLLAFVLALRGEAVLHASAVQIDDVALGFVGASGMGKSTMATLLCAAGARLITDDLLRLDLTRTPPGCALGATELRLRKAADELSARFTIAPPRRSTGDARDALATPASLDEGLPLAALIVPVPDRSPGRSQAAIERLSPKDALLLLSRFPRLLGWQDDTVLGRSFDQLADIVAGVPVHLAWLPWGPPFHEDLVTDLLENVLGADAVMERSA